MTRVHRPPVPVRRAPGGGGIVLWRVTLFRLFGIPVRIDASWLLLAALITWTLATLYFPVMAPGYPPAGQWGMALAGLLGLAASIVLHEAAHALVARRHGMAIEGITLFLFGGVAEMRREPPTALGELMMALAGPALSLALGLGCLGGTRALAALPGHWAAAPAAVAGYLALVNLALAAFNMLPAFPLDGGRVLRALLWHWRGDAAWATRRAAAAGMLAGLGLLGAGAWSMTEGFLVGGAWWMVIGLFLGATARAAARREALRDAWRQRPVWRYMRRLPAGLALEAGQAVPAESDAGGAAQRMRRLGRRHLGVERHGRCVGVVYLEDLERLEGRLSPSGQGYTAAARTSPREARACSSGSAGRPPRSGDG